jgi:alpha-galactosidase
MRIDNLFLAFMVGTMAWGSAGIPSARAAQQWTLATDDTSMTLGLNAQGQPEIFELQNPAQGYNWTQLPSPIALPSSVTYNGQNVTPNWQFQNAVVDNSLGAKLTMTFACTSPSLQMTTEWWAKPGAGPIHTASYITNNTPSSVGLSYQPTLSLQLNTPRTGTVQSWCFSADGGTPDVQGVYKDQVTAGYNRTVSTNPNGDKIPLAVIDAEGNQGLYVGTEWSYGDIKIAGTSAGATIQSGNVLNFTTTLPSGKVFEVPPGFVGTYQGNIDNGGNSLRKYLFNYNVPQVMRDDPTYPKVQWNACTATAKTWGSWDCVQSKYYPLVDAIAPLGFEEVMIDVGWWTGSEPNTDLSDWPSGMAAAAAYAHQKDMRFGLYWTDSADMSTAAGQTTRANRIKKLFNDYHADLWRSDSTSGAVIGPSYAAVKGFYDMVDGLQQQIPGFQWENCACGGRIKDYGAMERSVKIFNSDTYTPLDNRRAFYDSSFALDPIQIEGHMLLTADSNYRPQGKQVMKYYFRSMSMGAPEWVLDSPNTTMSLPWSNEEKDAVAKCVNTYKTKIRPLQRTADLYHIFPRPDDGVWDGIEYFDPATDTGVVYIFKPNNSINTQAIKLQGLDADRLYHLSFEDGSNPEVFLSGAELMSTGINVTLYGTYNSELMFIEVPEPGLLTLLGAGGVFIAGMAWRRRIFKFHKNKP